MAWGYRAKSASDPHGCLLHKRVQLVHCSFSASFEPNWLVLKFLEICRAKPFPSHMPVTTPDITYILVTI